jgi:tryptophan 2-monooxygenase
MPVFPNLRRSAPRGTFEAAAPATPVTFVDTPSMDYVAWLTGSGSSIAQIPNAQSCKVAVIGSGGAGLAAAYELLRCGVNVTLFEATNRVGGRLFSSPSSTGDGNVFEMGAMRFTPSEQVLHYYANVFNASGASSIVFDTGAFPDPGVNLTYIAFQGQGYVWNPNSQSNTLPPSFNVVSAGWQAFMDDGFQSHDGTISLVAPSQITTWLATPQQYGSEIRGAWQGYIDAFENSSLYEAVVRIFTDPSAPGGAQWNETDLEFFGALGTGFGGFGPLFPIGFLDIMRFVINAVDSDQHEITTGVVSVVDGFLNQKISLPQGGTTTVGQNVQKNKPVAAVASTGKQVTLTFADSTTQTFDRVVVATSHRSMELTMGLGVSQDGLPLAENVADAVRRVHIENSSKVFAEVEKFWVGGILPRNVVGDTILRNLYTLDYPGAPADKGVLLFSYTWADDSVKQQTFDVPSRLALLERDLSAIQASMPALTPPVATAVKAAILNGTAQVIDWQCEPYFFGAFKLAQPGQDVYVQALFYDFLKAGTSQDTGVYLAGDSIGFLGGWVENAFQTGVNAAAGVAVSLGGTLTAQSLSPFAQLDPAQYSYDVLPAAVPAGAPRKVAVPALAGEPAGAQQA